MITPSIIPTPIAIIHARLRAVGIPKHTIDSLLAQTTPNMHTVLSDKSAEDIMISFSVWEQTREGYSFWQTLYDSILNNRKEKQQ